MEKSFAMPPLSFPFPESSQSLRSHPVIAGLNASKEIFNVLWHRQASGRSLAVAPGGWY
jgi:hypothetical protein